MSPPRKQCKKCPWRVGVDPFDIPNEYCPGKHRALQSTIAEPADLRTAYGPLHMMACHETGGDTSELPCVGWLVHQLGPGNNLGLRLAAMYGRVNVHVEAVGEQHPTLEATFPGEIL